ncbi:MAG: hypothetical protein ACOZNI_26100 [Myxococcota bacterium]
MGSPRGAAFETDAPDFEICLAADQLDRLQREVWLARAVDARLRESCAASPGCDPAALRPSDADARARLERIAEAIALRSGDPRWAALAAHDVNGPPFFDRPFVAWGSDPHGHPVPALPPTLPGGPPSLAWPSGCDPTHPPPPGTVAGAEDVERAICAAAWGVREAEWLLRWEMVAAEAIAGACPGCPPEIDRARSAAVGRSARREARAAASLATDPVSVTTARALEAAAEVLATSSPTRVYFVADVLDPPPR